VALWLTDGVLALSQGVPKLDGLVAGARDDLAVVNRKSNGKDILGVAQETASGGAVVDVPKAEGAIPRAGDAELAVGGDDNVLDVVAVATESSLGESVVAFLAGQAPDDDGLITVEEKKKKKKKKKKKGE